MNSKEQAIHSHPSAFRRFFQSQSAGGILLMGVAVLALLIANSLLSALYFDTLQAYVGGMSVLHWVNDGLMAVFFLLVGLEIKREFLDGPLASWDKRVLPGVAALGGVAVPAGIYVLFNGADPQALRGWAVPTARCRQPFQCHALRWDAIEHPDELCESPASRSVAMTPATMRDTNRACF